MKRIGLPLLVSCCLTSISCFSQVYVNGVAIDTVSAPFCQLICSNADVLTRAGVTIDYGQRYVNTGLNRQKIAGPDKKTIAFASPIDALNFMVRNGWEFVSFQVLGNSSGAENTFIYILKRKNV